MLDRSEQQSIRRKVWRERQWFFQYFWLLFQMCPVYLTPTPQIFQATRATPHILYNSGAEGKKCYWSRPLVEEGNSSHVVMLLPCRIGWPYILILSDKAMSHQSYLLVCCFLQLGIQIAQQFLCQQSCNSWCDVGTAFELFANHSLVTHTIFY